MKLLTSCFTLIFLITSCNSKKTVLSKSTENSAEQFQKTLIYSALTRGFIQELIITKTNLTEFRDYEKRNPISRDLEPKKWEDCLKLLNEIDLKNVPNLKSPTNYRQYDGAAFAQLTIIQKGDTIQSSSFDHKHPPVELKPLVEYILSIPEN